MRRWLIGAVVALLVVSVSAAVVAGSSFARGGGQTSENSQGDDGAARPYIGIVVSTLGSARAEEMGVDGGAVVQKVLEDGPAGGVLEVGDVVLSVNGDGIAGARDLAEIVRSSQPSDLLTMDILRDGQPLTVEVTVGEGGLTETKWLSRFKGRGHLGILGALPTDRVWRGEIVIGAEGGSKTVAMVSGLVAGLDPDAGTITVSPADGAGDETYTLNDEVHLSVDGRMAELSDVEVGQSVWVVSVDDDVTVVAVGELRMRHGFTFPARPRFYFGGAAGPRFFMGRGFEIGPETKEWICDRLPEGMSPAFCDADDDEDAQRTTS